jgi:hypothetical protein
MRESVKGRNSGYRRPLAGVNWQARSYNPETHLMYMCVGDAAAYGQVGDAAGLRRLD